MKQTLGETKTGVCIHCGETYQKRRYDQVLCSRACKTLYNNWKWQRMTQQERDRDNWTRRRRYYENREQVLAAQKAWRSENPDKAKERDHQKYLRNREKILVRSREYHAKNPHVGRKSSKNQRLNSPWIMLLTQAKRRAKERDLAFDLTREWAIARWTNHCEITGLPFVLGTVDHYPRSPSIDRIDSSQGYTQDNCRFILFAVNSLRGKGTDEEMVEIAQAIVRKYSTDWQCR